MARLRLLLLPLLALLETILSLAQDPGELARTFCDDADPKHNCPGVRCACVDETLEITFDKRSQSVLDLPGFLPGSWVEATVVMDVKGPEVFGWSYGVEHDGDTLDLLQVSLEGTDGEPQGEAGACCFQREGLIESCEDDPDPACANPKPATGFVSAVILSLIQPIALDVRRNTLAFAQYSVLRDPGPAGTTIQIVDHLKWNGTRVRLSITRGGQGYFPRRLVDGLIRRHEQPFRRGDLDGSGRISIADVVGLLLSAVGGQAPPRACADLLDVNDDGRRNVTDALPLLAYIFQRGPPPPEPFLACGLDPTDDALDCAQSSCR